MSRSIRNGVLASVLCLATLGTGCIGSFNLTRQVHHWNVDVGENRWTDEVFFLLLVIVPVYELCLLGDALIFNSIEFWSGENVIADPGLLSSAERSDAHRLAANTGGSGTHGVPGQPREP